MRPGRKIGTRALLATLGVLIMVYPDNLAKIAGIAVFAAVFVAEKVMIRGLKLPFGRGASQ
jgi:hypothetical protein